MTAEFGGSRVNRDWYSIAWREERLNPPTLFGPALQVPGVCFHSKRLDIPRTAWELPQVRNLCSDLGLKPPVYEGHRYYETWKPAREPFAHQLEVTDLLMRERGALICDDMGLGKTGSAIQAMMTARSIYNFERPGLIIAPLRLRRTWVDELLVMGAIEDESGLLAVSSRDLDWPGWREGADFYFVHGDVLDVWWSRLYLQKPAVVCVDEAHLFKNGRSRRGKAALITTNAIPFRLVMTGTPIDNNPRDFWHLLAMAHGSRAWGSAIDYRKRYCGALHDGFGYRDDGVTHLDELRERLETTYIRREVEDTGIILPEFSRAFLEVDPGLRGQECRDVLDHMSPAEMAALVEALMTGSGHGRVIETLGRLRKATSAAKAAATIEHVQGLLEQGVSCVVFCWQRQMAERIAKGSGDGVVIHGGMSQKDRDTKVGHFQVRPHERPSVIAATYGALAEGVTLHRARAVVLHDLDWVPAPMLQAEKRIHRIGQKNTCVSYWMQAAGTLDTLILSALRRKLGHQADIFGAKRNTPLIEVESFEDRFTKAIEEWRQW